MLQSVGSQRVGHDLATEQQQPMKNTMSSAFGSRVPMVLLNNLEIIPAE